MYFAAPRDTSPTRKRARWKAGGVIATILCCLVALGAEGLQGLARAAPPPASMGGGTLQGIRGLTVGPVEHLRHPGRGYGSPAFRKTLEEIVHMGGTWIALTPFGRVGDLEGRGVDLTFETPFAENRKAVERAIDMAHAYGLRVMLVPHLWVESGGWRAEIHPKSDRGWAHWVRAYSAFVLAWAKVAAAKQVEVLSAGVELRSWVTTARAPSFVRLLQTLRRVYPGKITYGANWDDVDDTVILGELDLIGINAFYPLAEKAGANETDLTAEALRIRDRLRTLSATWQRPILFTEVGYTTRPDPAVHPWEWPEDLPGVTVDEGAQATAYRALLHPMLEEPWFAGFFAWRVYADPEDMSQEAEWGFSPRGKQAERVLRDAFSTTWSGEKGASL